MDSPSELQTSPAKRLRTLAGTPYPSSKGKEKMSFDPLAAGEGSFASVADLASPEVDAAAAAEEEGGGCEGTCGICLSDGGPRSIPGRIDSCDHYFCFICIMEWAKIESRCPMCKRRFRSIRRPPVDGIFRAERLVDVPVRDQLYNPLGNDRTGTSEPYAYANCSVCHGSGNEELLLLCDLCDSGAHTYCVGLGATVPEGDWYCPDCTISRDEHSKSQVDTDVSPQDCCENITTVQMSKKSVSGANNVSGGANTESSYSAVYGPEQQRSDVRLQSRYDAVRVPGSLPQLSHRNRRGVQVLEQSVSVFDIVSDEPIMELTVGLFSANPEQQRSDVRLLPRNSYSIVSEPTNAQMQHSGRLTNEQNAPSNRVRSVGRGARTLHDCRNVHERIRLLRQNWNALRVGQLAFSSKLTNHRAKKNLKEKEAYTGIDSNIPKGQEPLSHAKSVCSAYVNAKCNTSSSGDSRSIDKAWKMMELAKEVGKIKRGNNSTDSFCSPSKSVLNGVQKIPLNNMSTQKELLVDNESEEKKNFTLHKKCKLQTELKGLVDAHTVKKQTFTRPLNALTPELSTTVGHFFLQQDTQKGKAKAAPQQVLCQSSYSSDLYETSVGQGSYACAPYSLSTPRSKSYVHTKSLSPELPYKKPVIDSNAEDGSTSINDGVAENAVGKDEMLGKLNLKHKKKELPLNKHGSNGHVSCSSVNGKSSRDEGPKSEIQSLVKLNLKLLDRDKSLGSERFKEVARMSTHTILAACGLPCSSSNICSLSAPVCKHTAEDKQLQRSNLMPESCRQCFYTFVQNVVKSIMSDKEILPKSR